MRKSIEVLCNDGTIVVGEVREVVVKNGEVHRFYFDSQQDVSLNWVTPRETIEVPKGIKDGTYIVNIACRLIRRHSGWGILAEDIVSPRLKNEVTRLLFQYHQGWWLCEGRGPNYSEQEIVPSQEAARGWLRSRQDEAHTADKNRYAGFHESETHMSADLSACGCVPSHGQASMINASTVPVDYRIVLEQYPDTRVRTQFTEAFVADGARLCPCGCSHRGGMTSLCPEHSPGEQYE